MQIKIGWQNINSTADGIRVYRSATPIIQGSLPAVYDTIAGNATNYTDVGVILGSTYYYMLEVFKGSDSVFSQNIQAAAMPYSGPGGQTLLAGDLDAGYYGIVAASDFISWDAFITWSGITVSSKNPNATQDWLKFSFKGRTLFMPKQPFGTTTWSILYAAGLVYGTNDNGPRDYNTLTAANQLKTLTIAGSQFKARLPTALPAGFDLTKDFVNGNTAASQASLAGYYTNDSNDSIFDLSGSEWNDLFYKLFTWTPATQRGENWAQLDNLLAANGAASYVGCNSDNLFQELVSGQKCLNRGILSTNTYHPGKTNTTAYTNQLYWRPVLELIPG